jgi:hypothetical protein
VTEDTRAPQRRSVKQLNMSELLELQPTQGRCDYFFIPCGSCLPFVLPSGALAGRYPARSRLKAVGLFSASTNLVSGSRSVQP